MATLHDFMEMWQGSQNLCAIQKEGRAQNKPLTAAGYILDTEKIVKASWSLVQHDGAAAYKLSERSLLPPALSANDLPGGRTQILSVRIIRRIRNHPVPGDEDCAPESISDTENWLNWYGDFDNAYDSQDDRAADIESDIEQENGIEDPEYLKHHNVSAAPNVPGLIRPIQKSMR